MSNAHELKLNGCTPEPLMNYLKALGILRLVSEQKDQGARGAWVNDVFVLRSSLDRDELISFFLEEYEPTPIIVPWSARHFFGVDRDGSGGPYKETPTSTTIIEAFLASSSERLSSYRRAILTALDTLEDCGIRSKSDMGNAEAKSRYIACLRSVAEDSVVDWIDAAAIMTAKKASFSAILGSGGGSDGNTHFSDNFMQNLWEILPDFERQRGTKKVSWRQTSTEQLVQAIFRTPTKYLVGKRTSSLYDSGAIGGPNATQGIERASLGNPWSFVLCLEGATCLAGAISRRNQTSSASFPFQVRMTTAGSESMCSNEAQGFESWLPIHSSWISFPEFRALLAEGRADLSARSVKTGVDVAKAAAGLAVDRGIESLQRFGIVKGRLGDTSTAASLGQFRVRFEPNVDLLSEIALWLDGFRRAASKGRAPARFKTALHRIDQAIFQFCRFGGEERFQEIIRALGSAERALAGGARFREANNLQPLGNLSTTWLTAANDGSVEFELALSLASMFDREGKVGDLRANLEAVEQKNRRWRWADIDGAVVWSKAELSFNLSSVLVRRLMDADRLGCTNLPLVSRRTANIESICAFLYGEIDDRRLEELIWGLALMDHTAKDYPQISHVMPSTSPLPREFALFKLLFLPSAIAIEPGDDGSRKISMSNKSEGVINIRPERRLLSLLRAGRSHEAQNLAIRRLQASGLRPMLAINTHDSGVRSSPNSAFGISPQRLGAALLFPVSSQSLSRLFYLVIRQDREVITEKEGTL